MLVFGIFNEMSFDNPTEKRIRTITFCRLKKKIFSDVLRTNHDFLLIYQRKTEKNSSATPIFSIIYNDM